MFIKLTRLNGAPLWLNPDFIMRIEPWKNGALVVPAGDDLDYEVRETPAQLIDQLGLMPPVRTAAPAPAPVAVPAPAPTPAPAPAPVAASAVEAAPAEPEPEAPKKRTRKTSSTKKSTKKAASESVAEAPAEPAPAPAPAPAPTEPSVSISVTPAASAPASSEEDIVAATAARLKKHGCKSEKKILNSLKSMFRRKSDEEIVGLLQQMEDRGLVTLDDNGHATFA